MVVNNKRKRKEKERANGRVKQKRREERKQSSIGLPNYQTNNKDPGLKRINSDMIQNIMRRIDSECINITT